MTIKTFFLTLILLGSILNINANDFDIGKPGKWVKVHSFEDQKNYSKEYIYEGAVYLMVEEQYNAITNELYEHYVFKVVSETGIQSYSDIWADFEPGFQKITFHNINVHRGKKIINKLEKGKIKLIQNETELDLKVYNESFSIGLFLEDIKEGDIIEYSFTKRGINPVLKGTINHIFYLQYSRPVKRIYKSITYSDNLKPDYKLFNSSPAPDIENNKNQTTLIWDIEDSMGILLNDKLPSWYDPYDFVQISSFKSWAELSAWGEKIYRTKPIYDKHFKNELNQILKGSKSKEDKINRIIRFVQDDIRYVGIAVNEYSYKPHKVEDIIQKRFGDCKDKSWLLVHMLREIGVESYISFVNTDLRHTIDQYLPSPLVFNHAIVAIEFNDSYYFIDPTISNQRGSFKKVYNNSYGKAMVLKKGNDRLTDIKSGSNEKIVIKEIYEITDSVSPVSYKVISTYYNGEADRMRQSLKNSSLKEVENNYLNFYSGIYTDMEWVGEIGIVDSEASNIFEITENYKINSFWKYEHRERMQDYFCDIEANNLENFLSSPDEKNRTMPFSIYHPVEIEFEILFKNAKEIDIGDDNFEINNSVFNFSFQIEYPDSKSFLLKYRYKTLKDHVSVSETDQYLKDLEKILNFSYYEITWGKDFVNSGESSEFNILLFVIVFFFVVLLVILAFHLFKKDTKVKYKNPIPIGGWLILPVIGLFITPLYLTYQFIDSEYFNLEYWKFISQKDSIGYNVYWTIIYLVEVLLNSMFLVYSVFLIILLVKRRTIFPIHYVSFRIINLLLIALYIILVSQIKSAYFEFDSSVYRELIKLVVGSAIWIPYMLLSKRVKKTFVVKSNKNTTQEEYTEE